MPVYFLALYCFAQNSSAQDHRATNDRRNQVKSVFSLKARPDLITITQKYNYNFGCLP